MGEVDTALGPLRQRVKARIEAEGYAAARPPLARPLAHVMPCGKALQLATVGRPHKALVSRGVMYVAGVLEILAAWDPGTIIRVPANGLGDWTIIRLAFRRLASEGWLEFDSSSALSWRRLGADTDALRVVEPFAAPTARLVKELGPHVDRVGLRRLPPKPGPVVTLGGEGGSNYAPPLSDSEYAQLRVVNGEVTWFNEAMERFGLLLTSGQEFPIHVRRVFTRDGMRSGGRFYLTGDSLPRDARRTATLSGQPVTELDWSAMFLRLLSWFTGHGAIRDDPYEIPGAPRDQVKDFLVRALGAVKSTGKGATYRNLQRMWGSKEAVEAVEHGLMERYPWLPDYCWCDAGVRLQRFESEATWHVMRQLARLARPVVPLHDGFLVRKDDTELLLATMNAATHQLSETLRDPAFTIRDRSGTEQYCQALARSHFYCPVTVKWPLVS